MGEREDPPGREARANMGKRVNLNNIELQKLYDSGSKIREIASKFNVAYSTIRVRLDKKKMRHERTHLDKYRGYWKGKKFSDEHRKKISIGIKKNPIKAGFKKGHVVSEKRKAELRILMKGNTFGSKISGSKHYNWKGGISSKRGKEMTSFKYKTWRKSIFERDNYECQFCHKRNGYVESHHIKRWVAFPDLRSDINNGITLCRPCHNKTRFNETKFELLCDWILECKKNISEVV